MIKKKIQVWLPFLFSITMVAGMLIGYQMRDNMPGKSFFSMEKRRPIQEIMDLIEKKYVDDVNLNMVTDTAIKAMLNKLDPHSVFIPAEDLADVNEDIEGSFFGVGIEYSIIADTLHVIQVLKDGPSFKAGVEIGDKIIKVNDSLVAGKDIDANKARKLLRGPRNSTVSVSVYRNNQIRQINITRDIIPLKSVDAAYLINPTTGFIRLNKFSQTTYKEFMDALTGLNKKGMKQLILDLRDNGGGVLEEAVEIADEFLEGDKLITYTEGKHNPKKEYRCRRPGQFEKGKLIVLADENSASASEILLGALQEWDRAVIVGRRTFGKGLVQDQYDLSDGSAIRLTIARYFTPLGRSIQRPYLLNEKAYYDEIHDRQNGDEKKYSDSLQNGKIRTYKTKNGKIVYGGGGISPDNYVPLDTLGFTRSTAAVFREGIIGQFVYQFYLQNKQQLLTYKTPADFKQQFSLTEQHWKQFSATALKDSINLSGITAIEKDRIMNAIKAQLARQLWRNEGFFEVLNGNDPEVKKAMELLGN